MKKLITLIVVIGAIVFFGPKLVNKCDGCEEWFFGPGYEGFALTDAIADEDQTICKECAEKAHVLEITMGKSLDEYKKSIFD